MEQLLSDWGPLYAETDLGRFPVEPFNTFSNVLFLAITLYWFRQRPFLLNNNFKRFLTLGLPLLATGYLGGTLYHATRAHVVWMLMDVVPIYLIAFMTSIYHWRLLGFGFWKIVLIFIFMICLPLSVLWTWVPNSANRPTYGYIIICLPVVLPMLVDMVQTRWRYGREFFIPLIFIILALSFRVLDSYPWIRSHIPMGTHWLWHCFGAMSCHFLLRFMKLRSLDQI